MRRHRRGHTLVEVAAVCAIAVILGALALPSYRGAQLRAARLDGVQALTRLQAAQERHRLAFGIYAADLAALRGIGAVSEQGRYTLTLDASAPGVYHAVAQARGSQADDHRCPALTLDVSDGFAHSGPDASCWNR